MLHPRLSGFGCRHLMAIAIVVAASDRPSALAQEYVTTKSGKTIPIITNEPTFNYQRTHKGDVGVVVQGGYCSVGALLHTYSYEETDPVRRAIMVEAVKHPASYRYVRHDFAGMLRTVASGAPLPSPPSHDDAVDGVELVQWKALGAAPGQWIYVVPIPTEGKAGLVAWYCDGAGTNGMVTVVMCCSELEPLSKPLIDEFLKRYPSSMDGKTLLAGDWIDDDLAKWIDLLGKAPENEMLLAIRARNVAQYEGDARRYAKESGAAWEPWDTNSLRASRAESGDFHERARTLREKLEQWRVERKQNQ